MNKLSNFSQIEKIGAISGIMSIIFYVSAVALPLPDPFPTAPAEAGLIDMGPFLGIWMLIIYTWFIVVVFKKN